MKAAERCGGGVERLKWRGTDRGGGGRYNSLGYRFISRRNRMGKNNRQIDAWTPPTQPVNGDAGDEVKTNNPQQVGNH